MAQDTRSLAADHARILAKSAFLYATDPGQSAYLSKQFGGDGQAPDRSEIEAKLGREVAETLDELAELSQRYRRLSREAVERIAREDAARHV